MTKNVLRDFSDLKHLTLLRSKKIKFFTLFSFVFFSTVIGIAQPGQPIVYKTGDFRNRPNTSGLSITATNAWETYDEATGLWTASSSFPTAATTPVNTYIREGVTQTCNGTVTFTGKVVVGEGNAATATASLAPDGTVASLTVTNGGSLVVTPNVQFIGTCTTPAAATVSEVKPVGTEIRSGGTGYTSATVTFAAPATGTTATGTATVAGGAVTGITITDPGSGYTSVPAITITGDGTGATAIAKVAVVSLNLTNPGAGYTAPPAVVLGSCFIVGNQSTSSRSIVINGDLEFKAGANSVTGGSGTGLTSTITLPGTAGGGAYGSGNLYASTPVNFYSPQGAVTSETRLVFTSPAAQIAGGGTINVRTLTLGSSSLTTNLTLNASTLNVAGTLTKNSGTIDASNGTYGFASYTTPAAQTIAAGTFKDDLVRNLVVNNTAGVTLNQNLSVTNQLTMQAGLLNLPATGTLQVNGANSIAGTPGATSYINTVSDAATGTIGVVQVNNISAGATRTIPLGNSGNYLPVTINPSTTSTFATSVFTPATDNGTPNGTVSTNNNIVNAIYIVNRIAGTGTARLTLGFPGTLKGTGLTGIQNNQLGISRFNGVTWDPVTGSGDNTQNTATSTFVLFSPFRVEFNATPLVVPVKLGDITATKVNGQVALTWKVYNELNVSNYVVERSVDGGRSFSAIGSVKATGSSTYNFADAAPSTGKNFYRLKSVDLDSKYAYSKVLLVDFSRLTASISVSPNPVAHGFFTVRFANLIAGKVSVKMFSNNGQLVLNQVIDYNGNTDNQLINLPSNIAKGNYQLVISDGSNSQKASVIVE